MKTTDPAMITRSERAKRANATIDAQDWYESYGWHLSTDRAGDVELGVVAYYELDHLDDDIVDTLMDAMPDLRRSEAQTIVARARVVRKAMEGIASRLVAAIAAYLAGDDDLARELLADASRAESDHGDDPGTAAVRAILFEERP